MDYTQSNGYATDAGTGQRMHLQAQAIPTAVTDIDMNSVLWEAMEIVKAAGLAGAQFDKTVPATYQKLLTALRSAGVFSTPVQFDNSTKAATTAFVTLAAQQPGEVCYFARNTAPSGFLKANGALVSRSTYATLFTAMGTTFGIGDGATTFALPDLRGEFLRGWDDSRGVDTGRTFGTAQTDAMQGHWHTPVQLSNGGASPINNITAPVSNVGGAGTGVLVGTSVGSPFTDSVN
jgi:microcystin-dependent protein